MIHTKRLTLKPFEDSDQAAMIRIFTDSEIKQTYMLPDFESEEQAIKLFKRIQTATQKEDSIDCGIYLNGIVIGFANTVEVKDKKIELGYVISPEYQNQGYATETLGALIQRLFEMGYEEVVTGAFEENIASRRVMEKCGMTLIDLEEDIEYRGKMHHCVYYSIKKSC